MLMMKRVFNVLNAQYVYPFVCIAKIDVHPCRLHVEWGRRNATVPTGPPCGGSGIGSSSLIGQTLLQYSVFSDSYWSSGHDQHTDARREKKEHGMPGLYKKPRGIFLVCQDCIFKCLLLIPATAHY